jgi:hypothetical protein
MWYAIAVTTVLGVALIGFWAMLLARHAVPELNAGLPSIRFHIGAELLTAAGLPASAACLALTDGTAARLLATASLGAVVVMFAVLTLFAASAIAVLLLS